MPQQLGVSMPMLGTQIRKHAEFAMLAEDAGFDTVWNYEFWKNPFISHTATAGATSRIKLGIGVAVAFSRSPYEMANAAADVDELSGGRLILGIGPGAPRFLEAFHSTDVKHAATRMSEYIDVLRMSWDQLATCDPSLKYSGRFYRFMSSPAANLWGGRELPRRQIPIYLAAVGPRMMQLVGEKADGWVGYLCSPEFADKQVKPRIAVGAERAGRHPSSIQLAAETICSVHEDREVAMRRARSHVGMYTADPTSLDRVEFAGLTEDRDAVLQAILTRGPAAAAEATSDALVKAFSITGTPAEAREQLAAYEALDEIVLHPPYVPPLTAAESEDSFRQIVRAFAR